MENTSPTSSNAPSRAGFSNWIRSAGGAEVAACEQDRLAQILPHLFGYHALQVGCYHGSTLAAAGRIRNKFELRLDADGTCARGGAALAGAAALPFAAHSIDVVVLPHVLEYVTRPEATLQEIERVLIEDGRLIVTGFNPWSLWGLRRLNPLLRKQPPWDGRFHSAASLTRRLAALGFEVLEREWFACPAPAPRSPLLQRWSLPQKTGEYYRPFFSAAYLVVAQKRRAPVTPVKLKWHKRLFLSGASAGSATMAKPGTSRNAC